MLIHGKIKSNILLGIGVILSFFLYSSLALAEEWTYIHKIEKLFYKTTDTQQSQVLLNETVPIDDILKPGQSLKISIRVPPGVGLLGVSAQGVFDGQPGGRPLIAKFDYDPSSICILTPDSCPSTGAALLAPPFHATNASLSENVYQGEALTLEQANADGGKIVSLAIYHGASAPRDFTLFGPLAVNIGISDVEAYNAWVTNTTAETQYRLSIAREGTGNVTSTPAGINCGNGISACTVEFKSNAAVTLSATAGQGSVFKQWGGDCEGTFPDITIAMTRAKGCTAIFANSAIAALQININGEGSVSSNTAGISCGNGNTDCSATSILGSSIILTATPNSDTSAFEGWSGNGCEGSEPVKAIILDGNKQCTASFVNTSAAVSGVNIPVFSLLHPSYPNGFAGTTSMQVIGRLDEYGDSPYFFSASDLAGSSLFPLEDSVLTLNVSIAHDTSLGTNTLDIILLALWSDQQGQQIWMQKTAPQGSFDFNDSNVWSVVDISAALQTGFTPYRSNLPASQGFSTSFGSGRVVPPASLSNEGRSITLLPAYQMNTLDATPSRFFVTGMMIFNLPDSLLKSEYTVEEGQSITIDTNRTSGNEFIAEQNGCSIVTGGESTASIQFEKSINGADVIHSCSITGIVAGTTSINVFTNNGKSINASLIVTSASTTL